jgi:hypothetical protein
MPQMNVGVNGFSRAVSEMLSEWDEDVTEAVNAAAKETADEAAQTLHSAGEFGGTGRYKKGWTVTAKRRNRRDTEQIVHNKTQYQLTHLLEFGHATRNGGRTKEFPHIGKVADKVPEIFERKLRDMIGEVSS